MQHASSKLKTTKIEQRSHIVRSGAASKDLQHRTILDPPPGQQAAPRAATTAAWPGPAVSSFR